MEIKKYTAENYRNIEYLELEPSNGINIIYGQNGQGKTNIIEGIWLFTGCRSFRTSKCAELVKNNENFAKISLDFEAGDRLQNAEMIIDNKRQVRINGISQETPRRLLGTFRAVVFSPDSMAVVRDGPAEKRRFFNIALSLLRPQYANLLSRYLKTMAHRNALLKQMSEKQNDDLLDMWDEELAKTGAKITLARSRYVEELSVEAKEIYFGISGNKEELSLSYVPGFKTEGNEEEELKADLIAALKRSRQSDIRYQVTGAGPHKDDLTFCIGELCARSFGSQGQQRSCALALKLGEAAILEKNCGERPVALLDDVMSELDSSRQRDLLGFLKDWQVFITCCETSVLHDVNISSAFEVEGGRLFKR